MAVHIPPALANELFTLLERAQKVAIISHRNPDPDTIGSNLALREILEHRGKTVISACVDQVKTSLPFAKTFQREFDPATIDLIICVDAGSISQLGFTKNIPDLLESNIPILNIDHHASNPLYGSHHLVFPEAASTTLVLYQLFKNWGLKLTPKVATYLLYGLYYDTGSFMHSNTTAEVYEIGGKLLRSGAAMDTIVQEVFRQHSIAKLKLWGKIFEQVNVTDKNIAVAGITHDEIKEQGLESSDLSGAIDYLSMVKDNTFAMILSEDGKGNVRGSIRTKENDVDLSEVAGLFGGGGHKKASGFSIPGRLEKEVYWSVTDS